MIAFTSNKVCYFPQVNVFIACRFSKIYLQPERKNWLTFDFSEKRVPFSEKTAVLNFKNTKKNFQF